MCAILLAATKVSIGMALEKRKGKMNLCAFASANLSFCALVLVASENLN